MLHSVMMLGLVRWRINFGVTFFILLNSMKTSMLIVAILGFFGTLAMIAVGLKAWGLSTVVLT